MLNRLHLINQSNTILKCFFFNCSKYIYIYNIKSTILSNKIFLNFIFGCAGSLLLPMTFSSCSEWELLSSCDAQASS